MKVSIAGRIFLGIVLIQLISAGLILGWFFYSIRAELNGAARAKAEETVLRSVEATEGYFHPAGTVVQAAQRLLAADVLSLGRPDQLGRYFFEQLRLHQKFAGLYVGYPDGSFFYVMRSNKEAPGGTRTKVIRHRPEGRTVELTWHDADYTVVKTGSDAQDTYDPRTRPWYGDAVERRDVAWTKPYVFFTARKSGITSSVAVTNGDGKLMAVVGVDIEMSEVSGFLRQIAFGLGGSAFIVAPGGEVIAHNAVAPVLPDSAAGDDSLRFRKVTELNGIDGPLGDKIVARSSEPAGANAPVVLEAASGGQDYFVAMGQMTNANWPWQIIAMVPEKSLVEVARASNLLLIGVILLATALACAIGYGLAQSIGRPIAALHANAKFGRNGNIELMEDVASGYEEIGDTADILYELAEQRRRHGAPVDKSPDAG